MIRTIRSDEIFYLLSLLPLSPLGWTMQTVLYGIRTKYICRLQHTQNTLARVIAGNRTPGFNLATLSKLHWLPVHDRIKSKIATMTHKSITPHIWLIWSSGTLHAVLYSLPLAAFCLLLVVTSNLVIEVFAGQLLLSRIVFPLTSVLEKNSHNIPPTPKISSFPFSLCHCLVTHLSISDSFTTLINFLFTYSREVNFTSDTQLKWEAQLLHRGTATLCRTANVSLKFLLLLKAIQIYTTEQGMCKFLLVFHCNDVTTL